MRLNKHQVRLERLPVAVGESARHRVPLAAERRLVVARTRRAAEQLVERPERTVVQEPSDRPFADEPRRLAEA